MKTFAIRSPIVMHLLLSLFLLAGFTRQQLDAQEWAKRRLEQSPRHAEWIDLKQGERALKAFVVYPESKNKTPVILVIHEIFGLTDWVKGVCDQLAENGVIAIAPDLLSGQTFADIDGASKAISALPEEQVKADLDAAAEYALRIPAGNGTLAVCGFCWGGGVTFAYANTNPKLQAAYSFYGPAPDDAAKIAKIACPVYGFYAENDERVNATISKAQKLMNAGGKKYEVVIYQGAGHGFMRAGEIPNANEVTKKARGDAWARLKNLLQTLLAGNSLGNYSQ